MVYLRMVHAAAANAAGGTAPRHIWPVLCIAGALFLAIVPAALAQSYERNLSFRPDQVLPPDLVRGANHSIDGPVTSDGMINTYRMRTNYGTFEVEGTDLLRLRVRELAAVVKLAEIGGVETAVDSVGRTVLKPFGTAKRLLTAPGETVGDTARGVGRWFGRAGASLSATDPNREGMLGSVTGGSAARRKLAYDFGVDPYTTFPPLDEQLSRLAGASAIGGTATSVGLAFVTGGAGIAISVGSTSSTLRETLRDHTAAELEKFGREKLAGMGVAAATIQEFYVNPWLTPTDKAIIVETLSGMSGTASRDVFVARAARASSHSEAFFYRRKAELIGAFHGKVAPVQSFTSLGGSPVLVTSKALVGMFPVDAVFWTQSVAGLIGDMNRDRGARKGPAEFWITGRATGPARAGLQSARWTVVEEAGRKLGQ